jgi:hypothetical protein
MKQIAFTILFGIALIGCQSISKTQPPERPLSPEEVSAQIDLLRAQIIPPNGTAKAEIDAAFWNA